MASFGGEDVSALVFDLGSSTSKIGYAGMECPTSVFPSIVGDLIGESSSVWRPNAVISRPIQGLVTDWEGYSQLWEYAYKKLGVDASHHPLMLTDPAWNTKQAREKAIEMAFETFNVPAFYLGKSPVLSCYAAGRATGLVIEVGASCVSIVPVYDGYVMSKGMKRQPFAGDFLTLQVKSYLEHANFNIVPQYLVKNKTAVGLAQAPNCILRSLPTTSAAYHDMAVSQTIHDFKESVLHVPEARFDEKSLSKRPSKNFEFPNGFNYAFGLERFKMAESLFSPIACLPPNPTDMKPLIALVQESFATMDIDLKSNFGSSVVLTGATTLLPGFTDRMYAELHHMLPGIKVKVTAAGGSNERKHGAWIGGSILASLGTFQQSWISKQQYEEMGVSVEKRLV